MSAVLDHEDYVELCARRVGDLSPMISRRDFRTLLQALFSGAIVPPPDLESLYYRQLSGGFSPAIVALVWLPDLPTFIIKAGPEDIILAELAGRAKFSQPTPILENIGIPGASQAVEVEIDDAIELWRAMAYEYVGGLTYQEIRRFTDFQLIFEDFIAPRDETRRPTADSLEDWLRILFEQIHERRLGNSQSSLNIEIPKPLSYYLPRLPWGRGLTALLCTLSPFIPEGNEFGRLRKWWSQASDRMPIAPFPDKSVLHGDLRFANVLANRTTGGVELIDFGNVREGHVYSDLARFECDLLFRVVPPGLDTVSTRLSPDERRIITLQAAFSVNFRPNKSTEDPDNPQLAALRILRGVYDAFWHISMDPGRCLMYLWFLMAEILKRLLWVSDTWDRAHAGPEALVSALVMIKRAIDGRDAVAPGFAATTRLAQFLGCDQVYVPSRGAEALANRQRNADKITALNSAARKGSTVRLLAETGYSYLSFRGPFYPDVQELLERGTLQIVLANPFFLEGHGISAAFRQPNELDKSGLHPWLLTKFRESEMGAEELKASFGDRLQVRVATYGISATLLMTDDAVFFEPYLRSSREVRHKRLFDTFELRFAGTNPHIRTLMAAHFEFHWENSVPLASLAVLTTHYGPLLDKLTEVNRSLLG